MRDFYSLKLPKKIMSQRTALSFVFLFVAAVSFYTLLAYNTLSNIPPTISRREVAALSLLVPSIVGFIWATIFYKYRYRSNDITLVLLILFFTAFFFIVATVVARDQNGITGKEGAIAILAVGWVGTVGWIVTNGLSAHAARVSHTLNAVLQIMTSKEFQDHRRNIFSQLEYNRSISTLDDISKVFELHDEYAKTSSFGKDKMPAIDSIRYVYNYLEYMARGIRAGEFDGAIIYQTIGMMIRMFYSDYKLIFIKCRIDATSSETYEHLFWLLKQYNVPVDEDYLTLSPHLEAEKKRRARAVIHSPTTQ